MRTIPIECPNCDGAGEIVILNGGVDNYGNPLGDLYKCRYCEGTGTDWVESIPLTIEDLDMPGIKDIDLEDHPPGQCTGECHMVAPGENWVYTGTAYGGDDEGYFGEGRCYCEFCGADGDA